MRQLSTRIDDQLYLDLKARAAAEGRSMNALVSQVLGAAVASRDERRVMFERLRAAGRLVYPAGAPGTVTRAEAIATTLGAGAAAREAPEADGNAR